MTILDLLAISVLGTAYARRPAALVRALMAYAADSSPDHLPRVRVELLNDLLRSYASLSPADRVELARLILDANACQTEPREFKDRIGFGWLDAAFRIADDGRISRIYQGLADFNAGMEHPRDIPARPSGAVFYVLIEAPGRSLARYFSCPEHLEIGFKNAAIESGTPILGLLTARPADFTRPDAVECVSCMLDNLPF